MYRNWLLLLTCLISGIPSFSQSLATEDPYPLIGAQVFIMPGQTEEELEELFRTLHDMDMPLTRIRLFQSQLEKEDGTWDFSFYDKAFDLAAKYSVKVCATLHLEPNFKIPASQEDLEEYSHYISKVVPHFKDKKALDTWVLINEPGCNEEFAPFPDNEYIDGYYRDWLGNHRDSVTYSFERKPYNRQLFERDHTTWFLNWIADEVRKYDQTHKCHVNNHQIFQLLEQFDFPRWATFLDDLGVSIHPSWHFLYLQPNQYTMGVAAACDIVGGAAYPKPFWVTELQGGNNLFSGYRPICPSEEDIAQWLWGSIGSGASRVVFWSLNPRSTDWEAAEWGMIDFNNEPSERLLKSAEVARTIKDNSDLFSNAVPFKDDITILYAPESMILQESKGSSLADDFTGRKEGAHIKSVLAIYEAFQALGVSPHIKQLDDFNWDQSPTGNRLLVMPNMAMLPQKYLSKMKDFVSKGNKLIMTGLTGLYDQNHVSYHLLGNPFKDLCGGSLKEHKTMPDLFNLSFTGGDSLNAHLFMGTIKPIDGQAIGMYEKEVAALKNTYGAGVVVWVPSLIGLGAWQRDNHSLINFLKQESAEHISASIPRFKTPQPGVTTRVLKTQRGYVLLYMNSSKETRTFELQDFLANNVEIIYSDNDSRVDDNLMVLGSNASLVISYKSK